MASVTFVVITINDTIEQLSQDIRYILRVDNFMTTVLARNEVHSSSYSNLSQLTCKVNQVKEYEIPK